MDPSRRSAPAWFVPSALLLVAAVWVRMHDYPAYVHAGLSFARTADGAYHVHRALRTLASFPVVPVFDPLMNWPSGANCHWPAGFDQLLALAAFVLGAQGNEPRAAAIIVQVPALLGLLLPLACMLLVKRFTVPHPVSAAALFAVSTLALLLPLALRYSLVGMTDHHVAEPLMVALCMSWLLARFPARALAERSVGWRLRWELGGALLLTLTTYLFNVSALYLTGVACVLLGAALAVREPPRGARWLGTGAPAFGLGSLLVAAAFLPAMLQHRQWFSFAFPSLLYALALLSAGGAIFAAGVLARVFGGQPAAVALRAAGLLGLAVLSSLLLWRVEPIRTAVLGVVFGHLAGGWHSVQGVAELEWLFAEGMRAPLRDLGVWALATPVLLPLAAARIFQIDRERGYVFVFCCAWFVGLSLLQQRFERGLVPLLVVWSVLGLQALIQFGLRGPQTTRQQRNAGVLLVALCALGTLSHDEFQSHASAAAARVPMSNFEASVFLARHNPLRPDGTRAGVLTDWGRAHYMMWPARSGVVANGFLSAVGAAGFRAVEQAMFSSPLEAAALMAQRDLGWLLTGVRFFSAVSIGPERLGPLAAGPEGPRISIPFFERLPLAVTMLGGSGIPSAGIAHAPQFAPRWASTDQLAIAGLYQPALWLFEKVPGARIVGRAAGGQRVVARLELRVRGHIVPYFAWTDADQQGQFELVVAVASGQHSELLSSEQQWHWLSNPAARGFAISETQVRDGTRVELGAIEP